jgi:4-amino-4-deoxy-L-arabinose transferase-like glycosyltransferase
MTDRATHHDVRGGLGARLLRLCDGSASLSRAGWIAVAALLLAILLPSLLLPLGPDQALFFVSGEKILRGAIHYRDIVDVKPPLIYYLYASAIALFGKGWIAIRIFDLLVQGATCWLMAALVRRSTRNDLMAAAAPVIYLLLYFGESYASAAQAEGYVGLLGLGAAWLLLHGRGRGRGIAIGALCGLLFLLKFPLGGMLAVVLLADALIAWRETRRIALDWLRMIGGFAAVAALLPIYILGNGAYHDFLGVNQFTAGYARTALQSPSQWLRNLIELPALHLCDNYSLLILALTLAGLALSMGGPEDGRPARNGESALLRFCALALLLLLGTIAVEGKYAFYHFLRLYPFGAILAAAGGVRLLERMLRAPRSIRYTPLAWALAAAVAVILSPLPRYADNTLSVAWAGLGAGPIVDSGDREAIERLPDGDALLVGRYVRDHLRPGEKIFVASSMPGLVYYQAGMVPEFKVLHFAYVNAPFAPDEWKRETSAYLLAERPRFIAAELNDVLPDITGTNDPSIVALRRLPGIDSLLDTGYRAVLETPRLRLFERLIDAPGIASPRTPDGNEAR